MMLRVLIVDDEPLARARLRRLLAACRQPEAVAVGEAATAAHAMTLAGGVSVDAVLLDVQMPGADGMQLAAAWRALPCPPAVVFVTAHPEYAVQAFELDAVDYVTKPVRLQRLQAALQKVVRERRLAGAAAAPQYLTVSTHGRSERVPLADVLYFRAEDKYVVAYTADAQYLLDDSLVQLERAHAPRFLRIHRNALVARNAIRALVRMPPQGAQGREGWAVQLAGSPATLAVSRRQQAQVRAILEGRPPSPPA